MAASANRVDGLTNYAMKHSGGMNIDIGGLYETMCPSTRYLTMAFVFKLARKSACFNNNNNCYFSTEHIALSQSKTV